MPTAFPREVLARVRKLVLLPGEIKQRRWDVTITKLTTLKSLCKEPEVANRNEVIQAELAGQGGDVDAVVIDEIGKMEMFSPLHVEMVPRLLDCPVPVVATVAQHGLSLIAQIKVRQDVQLIDVSCCDRDSLPEVVEYWLRDRLSSP